MNPLLDLAARPVIGHRGAAAYAPENTIVSFRRALELGAEALEFDVRRAADGVAVVMHDPTLDRTTDRTGPVNAVTSKRLSQTDAGYRFTEHPDAPTPFRNEGVTVPTLREVITTFPTTPLLIEIKEPEVQEAVARDLLECHAAERAVVAGNDWRALEVFANPPFHLGASRRDISRVYFAYGKPADACRCFAVPDSFYGLTVPSSRFVQSARGYTSTVHVWTVDDARSALRFWKNGVNGIVTNRPDVILAARTLAGSR